MEILLCIDDTDSLYNKSTGELAEGISSTIEEFGLGKCSAITRHQLLLHRDIQYTSHNSSMCFKIKSNGECLEKIIEVSKKLLIEEHDPESDPGLCVVQLDKLSNPQKLIEFGYMAKRKVLTKEEAYNLANELNIHLSEHGGTGQGVIGALAGTGLRLGGNDGRIRGRIKVGSLGDVVKVSEICSYNNINKVKDVNGDYLDNSEEITLGKLIKTVLIKDSFVLLVKKSEDKWETCSKKDLQMFEETIDVVY